MKKLFEFAFNLGVKSVGQEHKNWHKVLKVIGFILMILFSFAAFFYLFIYPYLFATKVFDNSILSFLFAMLLFMQLWMLVLEAAYSSFSQLYNLKRRHLFNFLHVKTETNKSTSKASVFLKVLLSYFLLIYGFALIYLYLSNYHPTSFESSPLSFVKAIYFSSMASTVGFSNINPTSDLSRIFVMIEVFICFLYSIVFFSLIASFIREGRISNTQNTSPQVELPNQVGENEKKENLT